MRIADAGLIGALNAAFAMTSESPAHLATWTVVSPDRDGRDA